jgi:ParB family chromosome partitioning protein
MPVSDIKDGVDKIGGYIGMLQSAKRATADQKIIDEVNDQIRKYSALKLRWQMELGRRTSEIEKTNKWETSTPNGRELTKTRTEKLKELGISTQRASENERMASEPEIVEKYIERTIEQDEVPTTFGALKAVQEVKKPHVVNNSKDDEWYTPAKYIESAREVLGRIDLDPASNDFANKTVKADRYFTEESNGLEQEWSGNIWMNPPYSTALLSQFADKLISSNFSQAIVLVNNATETAWFEKMISKASAIVFHKGRIRFVKRDGEHGAPLQGQAFIYYGDNAERFLEVFSKYGWGARL